MKSYLFIIFCLILTQNVLAQSFDAPTIGFNKTGSNYSLTVNHDPAVGPQLLSWSSGSGYTSFTNPADYTTFSYRTWIEYGDGNFTYRPNASFTAGTLTYAPLAKVSGIYTPPPSKPPSVSIATTGLSSSSSTISTTSGSNTYNATVGAMVQPAVRIVSNISDVKNGDEMHFAITYKLPAAIPTGFSAAMIIGYNGSLRAGVVPADIFATINPSGSMASGLPFVRTFSETANAISTPLLPPLAGKAANQYLQITNLSGGGEHNIFFTANTIKGLEADVKGNTDIFAYLILIPVGEGKPQYLLGDRNKLPIENGVSLPLVGERPHDPNFETINPPCTLLANKIGKNLDFHIHFQNTGLGAANKVEITTTLPPSINIQALSPVTNNNIKWTIGGNTYTAVLNPPSPSFPQTNIANTPGTLLPYSFTVNQTGAGTYKFIFVKNSSVVLSPMANPDMVNDVTTMGDIKFTIVANAFTPNYISSQSSIVFYGSAVATTGEPPILTNIAIAEFKESCTSCICKKVCTICDNPKNQKRSKFWQWLFCKECK